MESSIFQPWSGTTKRHLLDAGRSFLNSSFTTKSLTYETSYTEKVENANIRLSRPDSVLNLSSYQKIVIKRQHPATYATIITEPLHLSDVTVSKDSYMLVSCLYSSSLVLPLPGSSLIPLNKSAKNFSKSVWVCTTFNFSALALAAFSIRGYQSYETLHFSSRFCLKVW